jgi:hypothetical protein
LRTSLAKNISDVFFQEEAVVSPVRERAVVGDDSTKEEAGTSQPEYNLGMIAIAVSAR